MIYHLDWISSGISVWVMYVLGKKIWWGWVLSIFNLIFFVFVNVHFKLWGFLPSNAVCLIIFIKNAKEWYRDSIKDRSTHV